MTQRDYASKIRVKSIYWSPQAEYQVPSLMAEREDLALSIPACRAFTS